MFWGDTLCWALPCGPGLLRTPHSLGPLPVTSGLLASSAFLTRDEPFHSLANEPVSRISEEGDVGIARFAGRSAALDGPEAKPAGAGLCFHASGLLGQTATRGEPWRLTPRRRCRSRRVPLRAAREASRPKRCFPGTIKPQTRNSLESLMATQVRCRVISSSGGLGGAAL